jgi:cytochrome c-type biogenesis protein CcmE
MTSVSQDSALTLDQDLDTTEAGSGLHWAWILVIVLGAGGIGYMLFDGFKSETYFYTVDQAVAQGPALTGQTVRLKGLVEPGSVVTEKGKLGTRFRVTEKGKSIAVTYDKALPDTFKEGMEVVVQGEVDKSYTLAADEVLVKCPSRYEGQAPTAGNQAQHPADIPKTAAPQAQATQAP